MLVLIFPFILGDLLSYFGRGCRSREVAVVAVQLLAGFMQSIATIVQTLSSSFLDKQRQTTTICTQKSIGRG